MGFRGLPRWEIVARVLFLVALAVLMQKAFAAPVYTAAPVVPRIHGAEDKMEFKAECTNSKGEIIPAGGICETIVDPCRSTTSRCVETSAGSKIYYCNFDAPVNKAANSVCDGDTTCPNVDPCLPKPRCDGAGNCDKPPSIVCPAPPAVSNACYIYPCVNGCTLSPSCGAPIYICTPTNTPTATPGNTSTPTQTPTNTPTPSNTPTSTTTQTPTPTPTKSLCQACTINAATDKFGCPAPNVPKNPLTGADLSAVDPATYKGTCECSPQCIATPTQSPTQTPSPTPTVASSISRCKDTLSSKPNFQEIMGRGGPVTGDPTGPCSQASAALDIDLQTYRDQGYAVVVDTPVVDVADEGWMKGKMGIAPMICYARACVYQDPANTCACSYDAPVVVGTPTTADLDKGAAYCSTVCSAIGVQRTAGSPPPGNPTGNCYCTANQGVLGINNCGNLQPPNVGGPMGMYCSCSNPTGTPCKTQSVTYFSPGYCVCGGYVGVTCPNYAGGALLNTQATVPSSCKPPSIDRPVRNPLTGVCSTVSCTAPKVANTTTCQCECPSNVTCPAGQTYDTVSCACKCAGVTCPAGTVLNNRTCQCSTCGDGLPPSQSLDPACCTKAKVSCSRQQTTCAYSIPCQPNVTTFNNQMCPACEGKRGADRIEFGVGRTDVLTAMREALRPSCRPSDPNDDCCEPAMGGANCNAPGLLGTAPFGFITGFADLREVCRAEVAAYSQECQQVIKTYPYPTGGSSCNAWKDIVVNAQNGSLPDGCSAKIGSDGLPMETYSSDGTTLLSATVECHDLKTAYCNF